MISLVVSSIVIVIDVLVYIFYAITIAYKALMSWKSLITVSSTRCKKIEKYVLMYAENEVGILAAFWL